MANPQSDMLDHDEISFMPPPRRLIAKPCAISLRGVVQHYAWGKPKESSLVAAMATEQVRSKRTAMRAPPLSRGMRYAELWMGTHPNGHASVMVPTGVEDVGIPVNAKAVLYRRPSTLPRNAGDWSSDDEGPQEEWFLGDVIQADPCFWLGSDHQRGNLPFLFKVLSVRQALSVQAHPNKRLAEELHRRLPGHYPDDNHKPEICIPLGHFEALCGFRRVEEVRKHVREVEELRSLCVEDPAALETESLRQLYTRLMTASAQDVSEKVNNLVSRLTSKDDCTPDEELILRVAKDYPGDVGIFSIYFLNYVRVTPDMPHTFIYCAPDEPHAYLLGDCVECMAISDNVVRAGLTPKFKDVNTLLSMMTYRDDLLHELVNVGERIAPNVIKYDPPVEDFLVYEVTGSVPEGLELPRAAISACIGGTFRLAFGVVEGFEAAVTVPAPRTLSKGHTFFTRAGTRLILESLEPDAKLFVATY